MDNSELGQNIRRGLIETLQLLASPKEQLKYQRDVPIAFVTAELFCLWDDYSEVAFKDREKFRQNFSVQEFEAIEQMNKVMDGVSSQITGDLPSIEDFVLMPQSQQITVAATKALLVFEIQGS